MNKEKIIIIGGGVGPLAGVDLHNKIINNTITNGTNQGHLEVHHLSCSNDITDRTEFLLRNSIENPAEGMFRLINKLNLNELKHLHCIGAKSHRHGMVSILH